MEAKVEKKTHSTFNQVDLSLEVLVEESMSNADLSHLSALWWGDKTWA